MATQLCSFGEILSVKSDGNINGVLPSDELDHVPLIHRRSLLLANKSPNCNTEPSAVESGTGKLLMSRILIKEEDESCDSLDVLPTSALPPKQVVHEYFAQHQNHAVKDCEQVHCKVSCNRVVENSVLVPTLEIENSIQEVGTSRDCLIENSEQIKCTVSNGDVPQVKVESHISSFPAISTLSEVPAVAHSGSSCNLLHSMGGCIQNSSSADVPTIKDVLPTSAWSPRQIVLAVFAKKQNKECEQVHCKVSSHRIVEKSVLDPCSENGNCILDAGISGDCFNDSLEQIKCTVSNGDVAEVGKLAANVSSYPAISALSDVPAVAAHMGNSDNMLHSMGGCLRNSSVADLPPVQVKSEISDLIDDDCLDHIVLKERQRMLLSRKLLRMTKPALEISLEASSGNGRQQCDEKQKEQTPDVIGVSLIAKSESIDIPERSLLICVELYSDISDYDKAYSSTEFISCERQDNMLVYTNDISSSSLSTSLKIEDEPHDDNNCQNLEGNACDTFSFNMPGVKAEVEISNEDDEDERDHICLGDRTKLLKLKDDYEIKSVPFATEGSPIAADSAKPFSINRIRKRKKTATDSAETALEEDAPGLLQVLIEKGISTNEIKLYGQMESDEALDESSSGSFSELESVIMKMAICKNELRYITSGTWEECVDNVINIGYDKSCGNSSSNGETHDGFSRRISRRTNGFGGGSRRLGDGHLEAKATYGNLLQREKLAKNIGAGHFSHEFGWVVLSGGYEIFTQRHSFFKLAPIRYTKGSRTSYCLACLLSLVEQTRYLQFRKWPVEWGWCRDLQSFIFVFKGHNRIVLERPEYGYATYFFELVDSLSIDWQIKRLVTAMKLTTCSRISLIENKALVVGKDLTQGEAKVLIEYGWIPNSGFGTMLNYRDRVVHDRKNEKDTSEWRSKIGKLLMDGYNGGILVATSIPEEVESKDSQSPEVKLEPF
ncbi:hypothetical protein F8388_000679 [Cannabis sativa]|uniref:Uncharacterized protein n=1 Tax=Cannabis sativa TaxID=3483 RepID=A0A7J6HBD8_CANSA|nr:hypothetical protein F8388_000679 [Cannabis sativa]